MINWQRIKLVVINFVIKQLKIRQFGGHFIRVITYEVIRLLTMWQNELTYDYYLNDMNVMWSSNMNNIVASSINHSNVSLVMLKDGTRALHQEGDYVSEFNTHNKNLPVVVERVQSS